jgi:hypothetical protein
MRKMPIYKVQLPATIFYEIIISAETRDDALNLGIDKLMSGEGIEVPESFDWQDEAWIEEVV